MGPVLDTGPDDVVRSVLPSVPGPEGAAYLGACFAYDGRLCCVLAQPLDKGEKGTQVPGV